MNQRLLSLRNEMSIRNLDGLFIISEMNIRYLTGFTGDSSILIMNDNRLFLITDGRYTEQAGIECNDEVEIFGWIDQKRYGIETYKHIVELLEIKKLGFEEDVITYSTFKKLEKGLRNIKLEPVNHLIENLRLIKDHNEISALKKACDISVQALKKIIPELKQGITELEVSAILEYQLKMNGAEAISFDTIVLFGKRTSLLHGKPDNNKLQKGDLILFDFGALYKGYHADISRVMLYGDPDQEQIKIYNLIRKAQMQAVESIKPGIKSDDIDNTVREILKGKYLEYFYPGIGHGVGLEIHEEPFIKQKIETEMLQGMVLTIEPGIYIPGWGGIRIEDTVLVTENGTEILTNYTRELICI